MVLVDLDGGHEAVPARFDNQVEPAGLLERRDSQHDLLSRVQVCQVGVIARCFGAPTLLSFIALTPAIPCNGAKALFCK